MKKTKVFLASVLSLSFMVSTLHAASPATIDILATAPVSSTLTYSSTGVTNVTTLGTVAVSGHSIGSIAISTNDVAGFKVQFSSANTGKLVRFVSSAYVSSPTASDQLAYTISTAAANGTTGLGTGLTAPSMLSAVSVPNAASTASTLDYSGTMTGITSAYTLNLSYSASTATIISGTYKDTLTVTLVDN